MFQDCTGDSISMSYTVNGEPLGEAYRIPRPEFNGKPLFPHVLTKNIKFKCNFGAEDSWFPPLDDYKFVGLVPVDERINGAKRPEKREDCEVS